jgi:hypothetical protein
MAEEGSGLLTRYWRWWVALGWLLASAIMLFQRRAAIGWFALGDTDDNMRIMQVRGLLAGQGWFDLRQYRLDPPFGADIHWSRLVDLPIAGIMAVLRPILGGPLAEKTAVAVAPLLPMAVAMVAIALIARRLIGPKSLIIALVFLFCATSARLMWSPLRIDHHGWQLAMLALAMASFADRRPARGGLLLGIASAVSLTIGLELLIYLAASGGIVVLLWLRDPAEAQRLATYGISLGGGSALGFLLFASNANRAPVCDALSPVWLSAMAAAGALCLLLAWITPATPARRLIGAAVGGLALALAMAWMWPQCLGRLEGVSADAQRLWLDRVREARPIYKHGFHVIVGVVTLPLIGLAGYGLMLWRSRRDPERLIGWASIAVLALLSAALLLWQARAGPAAQLTAVPGAAALGWLILSWFRASERLLVRVFGTVIALFLVSGIGIQLAASKIRTGDSQSPRRKTIDTANRSCPTLPALRPIALLPKGDVLTFVDLAPRLIAVTHHNAVAGPYHRNDDAIVDVMKTFRGSAEEAQRMIARRRLDYVLICPNMSESTTYRAEAPDGFYAQLARGKAPAWLEAVPLPKESPYKIWRVRS